LANYACLFCQPARFCIAVQTCVTASYMDETWSVPYRRRNHSTTPHYRPTTAEKNYYALRRKGRSVRLSIRLSVTALGYRHVGCLQLSHERIADPSADGRRSAASRTDIGGGISSRHPRADTLLWSRYQCRGKHGVLYEVEW